MTQKIDDLIAAGEKATQGEWATHDSCYPQGVKGDIFLANGQRATRDNILVRVFHKLVPHSGNCKCTLDAAVRWKHAAPQIEADARFIALAANAREDIKAMHEENKRLRELLKEICDYYNPGIPRDKNHIYTRAQQALGGQKDD